MTILADQMRFYSDQSEICRTEARKCGFFLNGSEKLKSIQSAANQKNFCVPKLKLLVQLYRITREKRRLTEALEDFSLSPDCILAEPDDVVAPPIFLTSHDVRPLPLVPESFCEERQDAVQRYSGLWFLCLLNFSSPFPFSQQEDESGIQKSGIPSPISSQEVTFLKPETSFQSKSADGLTQLSQTGHDHDHDHACVHDEPDLESVIHNEGTEWVSDDDDQPLQKT